MASSDLSEVTSKSKEMHRKYLGGRATFSVHCMMCRARLYLRARPTDTVPCWCLVSTGERHRSCAERKLWLGQLDLPDGEEGEGDEEAAGDWAEAGATTEAGDGE